MYLNLQMSRYIKCNHVNLLTNKGAIVSDELVFLWILGKMATSKRHMTII